MAIAAKNLESSIDFEGEMVEKTGHKEESGRNFFIITPSNILKRRDIGAYAKLLWSYLRFRQGQNDYSWPTENTIAEDLGSTRATVIRARKELEAVGLLQVDQAHGGKRQQNYYRISLPGASKRPEKLSTPAHRNDAPGGDSGASKRCARSAPTINIKINNNKNNKQGLFDASASVSDCSEGLPGACAPGEHRGSGHRVSEPASGLSGSGIGASEYRPGGTSSGQGGKPLSSECSQLRKRAVQHARHAVGVADRKGRAWSCKAVEKIMLELCRTHDDLAISWVIEHKGPEAITPGLIRDQVLRKPTAAQKAEIKRREEQQRAENQRRRREELAAVIPGKNARLARETMEKFNLGIAG